MFCPIYTLFNHFKARGYITYFPLSFSLWKIVIVFYCPLINTSLFTSKMQKMTRKSTLKQHFSSFSQKPKNTYQQPTSSKCLQYFRSSHHRCSVKKGVLRNFTDSQENTCEFWKISKNTFFTEHLWTTASGNIETAYVAYLFFFWLTLSWRSPLSYRKSMDWFLYDNGLRHERVKLLLSCPYWFPSNSKRIHRQELFILFF